jgi:hypothetical protein
MLHLLPNIHVLLSTSTLNRNSIGILFVEDVGKRGLAIFLVFGMEVLLCWVNFGERAFTHAHQLNRWGMWILVGLATGLHYMCADAIPDLVESTNANTPRSAIQHRVEVEIGAVPESQSRERDNPETATLLTNNSGISSLSENSSLWFSVNLHSSRAASSQYGSLPDGSHVIPERVGATFISSWRSELERVRILFDVLIASWALWVIRRDVSIIHTLARMPSTRVWGKFPAWILWISLVSAIVSGYRALQNSNGQIIQHFTEQQPKDSRDNIYRYTGPTEL